jgi:hypothetical protein
MTTSMAGLGSDSRPSPVFKLDYIWRSLAERRELLKTEARNQAQIQA